MPNLGMGELMLILAICLLVFGGSRLPQIGEGIGKAIRGLKRGLNTDDDIEVTPQDKRVTDKAPENDLRKESIAEAEVVERAKQS